MSDSPLLSIIPLGAPPWPTFDPFLFCVHHDDEYPRGNDALGPDASLSGRQLGMDFEGLDGWRMYHGDTIPGFPRHPHRGFETVTIGRSGFVDHADSLGATARFGRGDVQWMTAGRGIVHSEMFPLVNRDAGNPTGLFQIWLNLPAASKMVDPYFSMLWRDTIPEVTVTDADGRTTKLSIYAGRFDETTAPAPPPDSWASRAESDLAIWSLTLEPGARVTLPAASHDAHRTLYSVTGEAVLVAGVQLAPSQAARLTPDVAVEVVGGATETELLMLHGRPIGEPVAQYGPFVMNTAEEIQQAMIDYRRTQFGGWPWPSDGPVHNRDQRRFAVHADGRTENA